MVLMTLVACIITKVYSQISEQRKRNIRKEIRRKGILEIIPSEKRRVFVRRMGEVVYN
jgi:hypothetical protein